MNRITMRRALYVALVAVAATAAVALDRRPDDVKKMSSKELEQKIDSCIKNDLPLSAEPYVSELKHRAANARDSKAMLKLVDKQIMLNATRLETDSSIIKCLDAEIGKAWTPLKQMLLLRKEVMVGWAHRNAVRDSIFADMEALVQHSAYEVIDSNLVAFPMSVADYLMMMSGDVRKYESKWLSLGGDRARMLRELRNGRNTEWKLCYQTASTDAERQLVDYMHGRYFWERAFELHGIPNRIDSEASADSAVACFERVINGPASPCGLVDEARKSIGDINSPYIAAYTETPLMANRFLPVRIEARNVDTVTVGVYEYQKKIDLAAQKPLKEYRIAVPRLRGRVHTQSVYQELDGVAPGEYVIVAHACGVVSLANGSYYGSGDVVRVTDICPVSLTDFCDLSDIYVFDAQNGSPLVGAKVNGHVVDGMGRYALTQTYKSGHRSLTIGNGGETVVFSHDSWSYFRNIDREAKRIDRNGVVVTDRNVYRPGHTVHFKVWCYSADAQRMWPMSLNKPVSVKVTDNSGKVIHQSDVELNGFGAAWGEFVIPTDADLGVAYMEVGNMGSSSFRIEQYKRTNNVITFDPITKPYINGAHVVVTGRATTIDGKALPDSEIKVSDGDSESKIVTDKDGRFAYEFNSNRHYDSRTYLHFTLVDLTGEVTENSLSVAVTATGTELGMSLPDKCVKADSIRFDITSNNANGQPFAADVNYVVERIGYKDDFMPACERQLFGPDVVYGTPSIRLEDEKAVVLDTVAVGRMDVCGRQTVALDIKNWPLGSYRVRLSASTACNGRRNNVQSDVWIYSPSGENVFAAPLFVESVGKFVPGQKLEVRVGSRIKNAKVLLVAEFGDKVIDRRIVECGQKLVTVGIDVPVLKYNFDNIRISAVVVNENRQYSKELNVEKLSDAVVPLNFSLETWRDKSVPGASEELVLVADSSMEVVASMYDERLDRICSNDWTVSFSRRRLATSNLSFGRITPKASPLELKQERCAASRESRPEYSSDMISMAFGVEVPDFRSMHHMMMAKQRMLKSTAAGAAMMYESDVAEAEEMEMVAVNDVSDAVVVGYGTMKRAMASNAAVPPTAAGAEAENATANVVRTDFRETVFFEPSLKVGADGKIHYVFRLPDSVTKYKLRAVATNKQMQSRQLQAQMQVSKPLTVKTWVPRTVVEGDTVSLSLAVLADSVLTDVVTSLDIPECSDIKSEASSAPMQTRWTLAVPDGVDSLHVVLSATNGRFTDGERHVIPVRKRCKAVVESQSFMLLAPGEHTLVCPLPGGAERLNSSFTYSANTWIEVLKALPHVAESVWPSSDTYLGQIETSAIAKMLKQRNDVSLWMSEVSDGEVPALLKGRAAEGLYDKSLRKLGKIQLHDGSFPWFDGMEGSSYLTCEIVSTLGLMTRMGLMPESDARPLTDKAEGYMLNQLNVETIKYRNGHGVSYPMLQIVYALATNGRLDASKRVTAIVDSIAKTDLLVEPQEKLMGAYVCLERYRQTRNAGYRKKAVVLLQSVSENLVRPNDQLAHISLYGHYWWCNQTFAHAMLLNTINFALDNGLTTSDISLSEADINRVQNWLMKEKRGTEWHDTQATSRAVLALLTRKADNISHDTLKVAGQSEPVAVFGRKVVANPADTIVISKQGGLASWGYWQQTAFRPTDDMPANASDDISVTRSISGELKVGSRVTVVVTVSTSVDMDFVRISDVRPVGLEPVDQRSGYHGWCYWWNKDDVPYYLSPADENVTFFVNRLPRGVHSFSYDCYVTNAGHMNAGYAEAASVYTDGLDAHSAGARIEIR